MIKKSIKESFLWVISALLLLALLLFAKGDNIFGFKILFVVFNIIGFGLVVFVGWLLCKKKKFRHFAIFGVVVAVIGFLVSLIGIFFEKSLDFGYLKILVILIISVFSILQIFLLLFIKSRKRVIGYFRVVVILTIILIALALSVLAVFEFAFFNKFLFRIFITILTFDILGTIVIPIINKLLK